MREFSLEQVFCAPKDSKSDTRGKFLSRLFGIFSEDIVRIWSRSQESPYEDLGRPTIKSVSEEKGYTLDFTFRHKEYKTIYIVEMKCEIEYEGYKYLTLETPKQLHHHKNKAFQLFLDSARDKKNAIVSVKGKTIAINGAILIWGNATNEGKTMTRDTHGIYEVLTIQGIINDLISAKNAEYAEYIADRKAWGNVLFDNLMP
jgi:hypothetical protein